MTTMPNLTLKNVPEELLLRLRARAQEHRRSLNSEILTVLDAALSSQKPALPAMLERIEEIHARYDIRPLSAAEIRQAIRRGRL
jgi:plasmid stability protein